MSHHESPGGYDPLQEAADIDELQLWETPGETKVLLRERNVIDDEPRSALLERRLCPNTDNSA